MSEIRKWLESIGLGQYGDAFEANKIAAKPAGVLVPPAPMVAAASLLAFLRWPPPFVVLIPAVTRAWTEWAYLKRPCTTSRPLAIQRPACGLHLSLPWPSAAGAVRSLPPGRRGRSAR
jgi:hypothetical protein